MVEYIDWFKRCKGAKRKIQGWEVEVIEFVCLGGEFIYLSPNRGPRCGATGRNVVAGKWRKSVRESITLPEI